MKGFKMQFFTSFCPSPVRGDFIPEGKSKTQQQFLEHSDVNWIVKHYQEIPQMGLDAAVSGPRVPLWGDFSGVPTLQQAYQIFDRAEASFAALPSDVRARFNNDPRQLLAFVSDRANLEEARKLGICVDQPAEPVVDKAASVSAVNAETVASQSEGKQTT